jgi:hypothetical protein
LNWPYAKDRAGTGALLVACDYGQSRSSFQLKVAVQEKPQDWKVRILGHRVRSRNLMLRA